MTYNKVNTYDWFKENLTKLADIEGYDHTNRELAMQTVMQHEGLVTGIVYHDQETKSYQEKVEGYSELPLTDIDISLSEEQFDVLVKEFM